MEFLNQTSKGSTSSKMIKQSNDAIEKNEVPGLQQEECHDN